MHSSNMWSVLFILPMSLAQLSNDPEQLLNWCLDGKHHKSEPGPESELFKQCTPWKERSCCTTDTTVHAHHGNLYNFNYHHCSHRKNMSDDCKRHFIQDLCFYECSPNVGPWTVKVNMKTRNQRFYRVPLCQSDCDAWFEACADDFTCTDNWVGNWDWTKSGNKCKEGTTCTTFKEVFKTPENFCQKIWDDSWEYTHDELPCMRIWFDGNKKNPNNNIAKLKVSKLVALSNVTSENPSIVMTSLMLLLCYIGSNVGLV